MDPFEKCPVCDGELETKQVEKLLRGGGNTASLKVFAEVCLLCGERLYAEDVVRSFEEIRSKLKKQDFSHLKPVGQSFTVNKDWPNKAIQPTT
jgi:YgiT-type zinc finger domain-containing protein